MRTASRMCYSTGKVDVGTLDPEQVRLRQTVSGLNYLDVYFRRGEVGPEDTLLIHAASGGVGSLLTQWASHLGATVLGTVGSTEKAERARQNGVDYPILYREENFVERALDITDGKGVSVVYDGVGEATFHDSLAALREEGVAVIFGWASGPPEPLDVLDLNHKSLAVMNPSLGTYTGTREKLLASAEALFDVLRSGAVRVQVGQRYPLQDTAEAHRDLEARRTTGSTLLTA